MILKQSEIKVIIGKVGFQISHYRSVERWPSCMSGGQVAISYIIALLLNNTRSNRRWNNVFLSATRLLHHLSQIFRDNSVPPAVPVGQQVDRKLRRKIREKKIAMGHKPDDHEEAPRQDMGGMAMGW